jgi:hypothetical protein
LCWQSYHLSDTEIIGDTKVCINYRCATPSNTQCFGQFCPSAVYSQQPVQRVPFRTKALCYTTSLQCEAHAVHSITNTHQAYNFMTLHYSVFRAICHILRHRHVGKRRNAGAPSGLQYGPRYIIHESGQHFSAREGRTVLGPTVTGRIGCLYHLHL